jgi:hypothetical protein
LCRVYGHRKIKHHRTCRTVTREHAEADFSGLHGHGSGAEEVKISASIGVACFPVDAESPGALLEKADEAMYQSKKTGRDGVSFFGVDGTLVRADAGKTARTMDGSSEKFLHASRTRRRIASLFVEPQWLMDVPAASLSINYKPCVLPRGKLVRCQLSGGIQSKRTLS